MRGGGAAGDHRSMPEHCVVVSLLPGRGESARGFMRELADGRRAEQERCERRVGIGGARWFLGRVEAGELLIGMIDSEDPVRAFALLSVSMDAHDLWFKRQLASVAGIDLNESVALEFAMSFATPTDADDQRGLVRPRSTPMAAVAAPQGP